jgi:hypothetical protein
MVYETLLKKLAEKQAMNERELKHVSLTEVISLISQQSLSSLNFWPSITPSA